MMDNLLISNNLYILVTNPIATDKQFRQSYKIITNQIMHDMDLINFGRTCFFQTVR